MSQKETDLVTGYRPMEGFYPAGSRSRAGPLHALVDFPDDLTYPREGPKTNHFGRGYPHRTGSKDALPQHTRYKAQRSKKVAMYDSDEKYNAETSRDTPETPDWQIKLGKIIFYLTAASGLAFFYWLNGINCPC